MYTKSEDFPIGWTDQHEMSWWCQPARVMAQQNF
jgi:hypothetical protein